MQTQFPPVVIERVDVLDCEVVSYDWPFLHEQARAIDAHWEKLVADKPLLFDGRVLLTCGWHIEMDEGRRIMRSRHFETGFKAFVAWLDFGGSDPLVTNSFAAAALQGADGGFLLGEMGRHTANAGKIYFPCGTPDLSDVVEGKLDMAGSVLRELEEETGLAPPDVVSGGGWTIVATGPYLACLKDMASGLAVDDLAGQARRFISSAERPELADVHCVRMAADIRPDVMPRYLVAYLERVLPVGRNGAGQQ